MFMELILNLFRDKELMIDDAKPLQLLIILIEDSHSRGLITKEYIHSNAYIIQI